MQEPPAGRIRLLIVDDDAPFAHAMMTSLSEDGRIDVVGIAADGEEALELSEAFRPDVMLLDLNMPRVDGYEVLRRINERARQPTIIVLTGVTDQEDLERVARLKPDALLQKTTDADTVVLGVVLALGLGKHSIVG
jgi:two-component system alkaline phosphatase synthesis response regulator PhoP